MPTIQRNRNLRFTEMNPPLLLTTSPTPNETAEWKTYRNEEYGFEFQYPTDWNVQTATPTEQEETEFVVSAEINLKSKEVYTFTKPWMEFYSIYPAFQVFIKREPFEDYFFTERDYNCDLEVEGCMFLFKYTQTNFNGLPARKADAQFPDEPPSFYEGIGGEILPYSYIVFNYQDKGISLSYPHEDFTGNYDPVYDQILSTFRFLE